MLLMKLNWLPEIRVEDPDISEAICIELEISVEPDNWLIGMFTTLPSPSCKDPVSSCNTR